MRNQQRYIMRKGFTLIELSIVLVIIGLIIGGVLIGQELIYQAKMRKVIAEYQQYEIAYKTFRMKYNCIPGDCAQAVEFFGADASNGNGNARIEAYESRGVCHQLGQSGLAPGCSVGSFPAGQGIFAGVNAIPSAYAASTILEFGWVESIDPIGYWWLVYFKPSNYIVMQGEAPAGEWYPHGGFGGNGTTSPEAQRIDQKLDDGAPFTGRFVQIAIWACGDLNLNTYYSVGTSIACVNAYAIGDK